MKHLSLLFLVLAMVGCGRTAYHAHTTPKMSAPSVKKSPDKDPCRQLYQKTGKYCAVVVAACRIDGQPGEILTAAVAVTDTTDDGKLAAEEAVQMLIVYFKGRPKMVLLTSSSVKDTPIFMFAITGVEPLPPPLPGSKPGTVQKRHKMDF